MTPTRQIARLAGLLERGDVDYTTQSPITITSRDGGSAPDWEAVQVCETIDLTIHSISPWMASYLIRTVSA